MPDIYVPVPANREDCIREATAADLFFTEAKHPPLYSLSAHAHARATITILLKGSFDESYMNRTETCVQSSILFRPPGKQHANRFGKIGGHNLVIEIDDKRLDAIRPCSRIFETVSQWRDARLNTIAQQIHRELRVADTVSQLGLEGLTLELLAVAARQYLNLTRRTATPPKWLRNVHDLLHDHFAEELRIADLATTAQVHPVYLARAFRAYYGVTPSAYLRQLRINWAAKELKNSPYQLSEIA
ncbi:MAG: AraC family transcriptional regulator, partial [Acidobacteriota bacterium]